jgi:hypothetical protein
MTEALHRGPDCYGRTELCRTLGVSRSGLYEHALKARGSRRLGDKVLAKELEPIFRQSRRTYGARRLQQALGSPGDPLRPKAAGTSHEPAGPPAGAQAPLAPQDDPERTP